MTVIRANQGTGWDSWRGTCIYIYDGRKSFLMVSSSSPQQQQPELNLKIFRMNKMEMSSSSVLHSCHYSRH